MGREVSVVLSPSALGVRLLGAALTRPGDGEGLSRYVPLLLIEAQPGCDYLGELARLVKAREQFLDVLRVERLARREQQGLEHSLEIERHMEDSLSE